MAIEKRMRTQTLKWVPVLALPLTGYVALDNAEFFLPQFLNL